MQESIYIQGVGSAVCDLLIAVSLVFMLRSTSQYINGTRLYVTGIYIATCEASESLVPSLMGARLIWQNRDSHREARDLHD